MDRDRLADDDMQVFLDIQKGALNVLLDHANDDGFILMSEEDVKEYMLWFIERLPTEIVDKCREQMLELYRDATGEPADLTIHITSARLLKSWLENRVGQLIELAGKHIKDYKPLSGEELASRAELVANGQEGQLIEYFQYSWALVEKAIEELSDGIVWWRSLPVILRRCQLSPGQANVIRKLRFILHQAQRSRYILTRRSRNQKRMGKSGVLPSKWCCGDTHLEGERHEDAFAFRRQVYQADRRRALLF